MEPLNAQINGTFEENKKIGGRMKNQGMRIAPRRRLNPP
jgi:hypothetical protein